jgi:hypothetical protein
MVQYLVREVVLKPNLSEASGVAREGVIWSRQTGARACGFRQAIG